MADEAIGDPADIERRKLSHGRRGPSRSQPWLLPPSTFAQRKSSSQGIFTSLGPSFALRHLHQARQGFTETSVYIFFLNCSPCTSIALRPSSTSPLWISGFASKASRSTSCSTKSWPSSLLVVSHRGVAIHPSGQSAHHLVRQIHLANLRLHYDNIIFMRSLDYKPISQHIDYCIAVFQKFGHVKFILNFIGFIFHKLDHKNIIVTIGN